MENLDQELEIKISEFVENFISADAYNTYLFAFFTAGSRRNALWDLIKDIDNNKFKSIQGIREFLIPLACESNGMLGIAYNKLIELRKSTTIH